MQTAAARWWNNMQTCGEQSCSAAHELQSQTHTHTHHVNIVGQTGDSSQVQQLRGSAGLVFDLWSPVSSASMSKCSNDDPVCWDHVNSCKFFSSTNVNESAFKGNRTNWTHYREKKTVAGFQGQRCMWGVEKCLQVFEALIPGGVEWGDKRSDERVTFNNRDTQIRCFSLQLEF